MSQIYSSASALVPVVNILRLQLSRLDASHSARKFVLTEQDESDYKVSELTGINPTIYLLAGLTYCFDIQTESPVVITEFNNDENYVVDGMVYYNDFVPIKMTGADANDGKKVGQIYWTIPPDVSGDFKYQNPSDPSMFGRIRVKSMYNITPMEPLPS